MIFERKRFAHSTVLCANDFSLKEMVVFPSAVLSKVQSLSMRGWISQPIEELSSLSTNVLLDQEISIKTQSRKTHISYILIWKSLESITNSKTNENEWKRNQQVSKIYEIHTNATPNLETTAYLCATYAQPMRELCAKSYHATWAGCLCSSAAAENIDL